MNLPDGLLEQAKKKAAVEGTSVTQLMIEGLRARIAESAAPEHVVSLPRRRLGRARVDVSDGLALRGILNADEDETFRDHR